MIAGGVKYGIQAHTKNNRRRFEGSGKIYRLSSGKVIVKKNKEKEIKNGGMY